MSLPTGWVETTIGDVLEVNPRHSPGVDRGLSVSFVPMPAVDEYEGAVTVLSERKLIDVWTGFTHFADGDVLFAKITPCMENGKIALAAKLTNGMGCGSTEFHVFRSVGATEPAFVWRFLRRTEFRAAAEREMIGAVGQRRVPRGWLEQHSFPLPPLAEQRRIVAKLDTLTARLRRARTELDRVAALAKEMRVAALRAIFHIDAEVPTGWSVQRIDEIGTVQLGRQRSPKDHDGPNMRPYLRSANLTWRGFDLADVKQMNFSTAEMKIFTLKVGDVLLNEGSGSAKEVGKPVVWEGAIEEACFQNTLLRIRPHNYDPRLLRYCLLYLAKAGAFIGDTQGINIIHIGKTGLSRIKVPVPPVDQQSLLLEKIDAAFAHADRLEAEAACARALLDRLEAAILARAFRGELVPQDPADEPAAVLLDRIRRDRATALQAKRGRRTAITLEST